MFAKYQEKNLLYFLNSMFLHAKDACDFLQNKTQLEYLEDAYCQKAVAMSLQIVGESASKIVRKFPDFVAENAEIPWKEVRGLRNQISHGYEDLNLMDIWSIVKNNLPCLLNQLEQRLSTLK